MSPERINAIATKAGMRITADFPPTDIVVITDAITEATLELRDENAGLRAHLEQWRAMAEELCWCLVDYSATVDDDCPHRYRAALSKFNDLQQNE